MIQRISENIVRWQIKKNMLSSDQRALYLYAYEVLLSQIINVLIAVLIAGVMHSPMPVFVFLVSYIPLRSYCGGYHARTNGVCTVVSAILVVIVCLLEKVITGHWTIILPPISLAVSGILILWLAPVADANKPLDKQEEHRYRTMSRRIWLIEALIGMIFWFFNERISVVIAISHILLSIMLSYGVYKNKKNRMLQ